MKGNPLKGIIFMLFFYPFEKTIDFNYKINKSLQQKKSITALAIMDF